jgi:hypothetical protein
MGGSMTDDFVNVQALRAGEAIQGSMMLKVARPCQIDLRMDDGFAARGEGNDLFAALTAVRQTLEENGIQIACNGARPNVHGSGMLRDASNGRRAYVLALPRTRNKPEVVDIFDPAPIGSVGTVAEQAAWYQRWLQSPLAP